MSKTSDRLVLTCQQALTDIDRRLAENPIVDTFEQDRLVDRQIHLLDRVRGMELREAADIDRLGELIERRKQDQIRHDGIVRTLGEQESAAKFQQVTNQAIKESAEMGKAAAEAERTYFETKLETLLGGGG